LRALHGVTAVNGPKRRVHFVGIGGIGMSGIAEVLLTLGTPCPARRRRARARAGWSAWARASSPVCTTRRTSTSVDVLVISSAVTFSNPEVVRARELKVPVIRAPRCSPS
jgi:UDP-N-acetylmuramate--alanine ligase